MSTFKLYTVASAPAESAPILDAANKGLGFIPNLYAHLAESPAALQAYKQLGTLVEQSTFTPAGTTGHSGRGERGEPLHLLRGGTLVHRPQHGKG